MKKTKTLGRYESPEYIEYIKDQFKENFPDNIPKDFIIDHSIKYFLNYIEKELLEERTVSLYAFGKFHVKSGTSPRTGSFQYYPKFKFSRHFNLRYRQYKGTTTEAEEKEIALKKEFMKNVWDKRKAYMIEQRGYIPAKIQNKEELIDYKEQLEE